MGDIERCMTSGLISLVSTSLDIRSSPRTAMPTRLRVCNSPSVHVSPHTRVTAQVPAGSAGSVHGSPFTPRRHSPKRISILVGYCSSAIITLMLQYYQPVALSTSAPHTPTRQQLNSPRSKRQRVDTPIHQLGWL